MKHKSQVVVIFYLLLFFYSDITSSQLPFLLQGFALVARSLELFFRICSIQLSSKNIWNELVKATDTTPADSSMHSQEKDPFYLLMGLEEVACDGKDEDCIKRRIIAEAHLDYIYTQRNKPQKASP